MSHRGDYAAALALYKQSQEIKESLGDQLGLAICLFNQSIAYHELKQTPKAIDLCQQAIAIKKACGVPTFEDEHFLEELLESRDD